MNPIIFDSTWEFQCGTKSSSEFQMMLNQWKNKYQLVIISCNEFGVGTLGFGFSYCIARKPL